MFKRKYKASILDSKWHLIKIEKFDVIPRQYEYMYFDNQYYEILNVVHTLDKKQEIFIIVSELADEKKKIFV